METETLNLPKVQFFKYLGLMIDTRWGASKDGDNRVTKAWSKWRELSGVIGDKKIEAPDMPDSDSTDVALRLRNMANVSFERWKA